LRERKGQMGVGGKVKVSGSDPFEKLLDKIPSGARLSEGTAAPLESDPAVPFRIARTRKGGWPVFVERRAAGKTVTIVRNLSGDTGALLAVLKKRCAAGGRAFTDSVEIQGDHRAKVEAILREYGKEAP